MDLSHKTWKLGFATVLRLLYNVGEYTFTFFTNKNILPIMPQQTVHIIRHGQSESNVGLRIRDPNLTRTGIEQAKNIGETYVYFKEPTLVVLSPLKRSIQTALYAFHPAFNPMVKKYFPNPPVRFVALPHLQESSEDLTNTGSPVKELKKSFGNFVEFPDEFFTSEDWLIKTGTEFADKTDKLIARGEVVKKYILNQPDTEIAVVSHADFIVYLTNNWDPDDISESEFGVLRNAGGKPTIIVKNQEGDHKMCVVFPPWMNIGEEAIEEAKMKLDEDMLYRYDIWHFI